MSRATSSRSTGAGLPDRLHGARKPVVCFGELLIRLTAPGRGKLLQHPSLDLCVGGAEANVAVGLAQLGHDCRMVGRLPDNSLGRGVLGAIRAHGVDCDAVRFAPGRMGLYFLEAGSGPRASQVIYDRAGSAFAEAPPGSFDWERLLAGAGLLHLSGITPALGPVPASHALEAARMANKLGVAVSFDGNYRASLWESWDSDPAAILGELIGRSAILFGNHRDLALVLGRSFAGEGEHRRREAAEAGLAAFPSLRMIASTARQTLAADHFRLSARIDLREGAHQTAEVDLSGTVDRIGAGDAFAAGVLHGWLTGADATQTAETGLALACLKHTLPGDASLFGQADIDAFLAGGTDVRR
jgi:2-dehydro-3-deoxygluconokinase